MQLCHHFARPMVERGRGAIVILGSGAGLAGGPNMVAYGASKAFDMVFAEALWAELHDKGVDVLGLILGKTDTPALRKTRTPPGLDRFAGRGAAGRLRRRRRHLGGFRQPEQRPHADGGGRPGFFAQMLSSLPRNQTVDLLAKAVRSTMGTE